MIAADRRKGSRLADAASGMREQASAKSSQCDKSLASRTSVWQAWHEAWDQEAQLPGDEGGYPEQLAELVEKLMKQLAGTQETN